jgi:hypothetical protein
MKSRQELDSRQNPSAGWGPGVPDPRHKPRFQFTVAIRVNSRTCGQLTGRTIDLSESGVSALLIIEVPLGELVELEFTAPSGPVTVYATVRQRSAFRYGFQFVESQAEQAIIRAICRNLEVEQSVQRGAGAG